MGIHRIPRELSGGSEHLLMCPGEVPEAVPLYLVDRRLHLGADRVGGKDAVTHQVAKVGRRDLRGVRLEREPGARSWGAW